MPKKQQPKEQKIHPVRYQYVYVLQSDKDKLFYTGYTTDLQTRLLEHKNGLVASTKMRRPLKLVYCEICLNQNDATMREKYLKSTWGKRYIKNRIKNYLSTYEKAK